MAGVANEVKAEVLLKVKQGEKVADLAKQYGVSDKSIYNWLKGKLEQEVSYREYKRVIKENEQLKNILGVLTLELEKSKKRSELTQKVITKHPDTNKKLLSQVFTLSRQALYPRNLVLPTRDELLKQQILSVLSEFPSYGYRRVAIALGLGKKRVRRVMRQNHIKPYKRMARWRKRRDERRAPAPYINEIKNQCPLTPNYAWVGDFTYLPFKGKFLYLATFMDLYTREIVGYHISRKHDKNLVMQAFLNGITTRGLTKPTYLHTDQGAEYTSGDYTQLAEALGVQISMSKKASPWENGYQESFYNNFKTDLGLEFDRFEGEGHFLEAIHHTLYTYNNRRIHTSLNMSPSQFHANYLHSVSQKRGA